jgi:hypothetical protein
MLNDNREITEPEKEKRLKSLYDSLDLARKKFVETMATIKTASPVYQMSIGEKRKPIPLATVQQELENEKMIALEYLIGKEKSWLLVYGIAQEPKLLPLAINEAQASLFGVVHGPVTDVIMNAILQNESNTGVLGLLFCQTYD